MEYFTKEELIRCYRERKQDRCSECRLQQAVKRMPDGIDENMEALVDNVLDPCRHAYGKPIGVNSGFRCPLKNKAVGGVAHSQHLLGEAADIRCHTDSTDNTDELLRLAQIIVQNGRFDQMILYPTFIHVSYKRTGINRHRILKKETSSSKYIVLETSSFLHHTSSIPKGGAA